MKTAKMQIVEAAREQSKLAGQFATLARDLAKSGGRNILVWVVALVVLWWTIELYAIDTRKKLASARVELSRATQTVDRLAHAQRELNQKLDAHKKGNSKLPYEQVLEAKTALKILADDLVKATSKLESANHGFELASQPDLIPFKPPVPGSEQFRLPYAVAPLVWASLLVGMFGYICAIRWRVFEFALRAFRAPMGAAQPLPLDETLAPAAWWMYPVPQVDVPAERDRLRELYGVGLSSRDQYPFLLFISIAALLALHFRVTQLSQEIHDLVNPPRPEASFAYGKGSVAYVRPRVDARRMDNSPESLAPIGSEGLLALNFSLAVWWLWPRTLRAQRASPLQAAFTRRTALGSTAAVLLALVGSFLVHTRVVGDTASAGARRSLARLHLLSNPRHRRRVSRHTPVTLEDGLYLNPRSNVIHVVSNHLLLGVGAFKATYPASEPSVKTASPKNLFPIAPAEAIKRLDLSAKNRVQVAYKAQLREAPPLRLNGSTTSFLAELAVLNRLPLLGDLIVLSILMACIRRDLEVKRKSGDRLSAGKRKKPRRRNRDRLIQTDNSQRLGPAVATPDGSSLGSPVRVSLRLYDELQRLADRTVTDTDSTPALKKTYARRMLQQMNDFLAENNLLKHFKEHEEKVRKRARLPGRRSFGSPSGSWLKTYDR